MKLSTQDLVPIVTLVTEKNWDAAWIFKELLRKNCWFVTPITLVGGMGVGEERGLH